MSSTPATTLCPTPETVQHVKDLLDELDDADPERQNIAQNQLDEMGFEVALAIQKMTRSDFAAIVSQSQNRRRAVPWIIGAIVVLVRLLCGAHGLETSLLSGVLLAMAMVAGAHLAIAEDKKHVRLARAIRFLSSLADKRTLPVLLDMYKTVNSVEGKRALLCAIITGLPKLEEADAALFSDGQRAALGGLLLECLSDTRYRTVILTALAKVGNASNIPVVKRLAYMLTAGPAHAAACECLEQLERRLAAQSLTLLRASSRPVATEDLLRVPVESAEDNSTLLRPIEH